MPPNLDFMLSRNAEIEVVRLKLAVCRPTVEKIAARRS
jgi:hypothetical protein